MLLIFVNFPLQYMSIDKSVIGFVYSIKSGLIFGGPTSSKPADPTNKEPTEGSDTYPFSSGGKDL